MVVITFMVFITFMGDTVDSKFNTVRAQVRAYWNSMQNLNFQFSVADFVKPGLIKHVLLM